jgi:uncharacterized protein (DUF305 family)
MAIAFAVAFGWAPTLAAQETGRTVQPGAPGEPGRVLSPGDSAGPRAGHTDADVHFILEMIPHHAQALEMTALVPERTTRQDFLALASRIERAQTDEIALMKRWLQEHAGMSSEEIAAHARHADRHGHHGAGPDDAPHHRPMQGPRGGPGHGADHPDRHGPHREGHGADHGAAVGPGAAHPGPGPHGAAPAELPRHPPMHGMLSAEEMATLAGARGEEFDRLFLTFMIRHHEGALAMVEELFAAGGGHTADMFQLVSHIDSDQRIEIARMYGLHANR